jgi:integrase/recombinase XerC
LRPAIRTACRASPVHNWLVSAAHPHALRHSFGTALAEAGVDLAVIQALLGHVHVDSSVGYIHLAPMRVRAAYDQARQVQRAQLSPLR